MSITVNCDMCGKEQKPEDRFAQYTGKQQKAKRLWSVLMTHMDYRATGAPHKNIQKKEYQICPECTEKLFEKAGMEL